MEGPQICEIFPTEINFQVKIRAVFAVMTVMRGTFHWEVLLPDEHSVNAALHMQTKMAAALWMKCEL